MNLTPDQKFNNERMIELCKTTAVLMSNSATTCQQALGFCFRMDDLEDITAAVNYMMLAAGKLRKVSQRSQYATDTAAVGGKR